MHIFSNRILFHIPLELFNKQRSKNFFENIVSIHFLNISESQKIALTCNVTDTTQLGPSIHNLAKQKRNKRPCNFFEDQVKMYQPFCPEIQTLS